MKNFRFLYLLLFAALPFTSCDKNDDNSPSTDDTIIQNTITVTGKNGKDDDVKPFDANRKAFINLYDGATYSLGDAKSNAAKIDFVYFYSPLNGKTLLVFDNMDYWSSQLNYAGGFSKLTKSYYINAGVYWDITNASFDNIKTSADIDALFSGKKIPGDFAQAGYLTTILKNTDDVHLYAFVDKTGKKGLIKIDGYQTDTANGVDVALTLHVKIQK